METAAVILIVALAVLFLARGALRKIITARSRAPEIAAPSCSCSSTDCPLVTHCSDRDNDPAADSAAGAPPGAGQEHGPIIAGRPGAAP